MIERLMEMLFGKKEKNNVEKNMNYNFLTLEILTRLCPEGVVIDEAFVIEEKDIYIYLDVVLFEQNVAQVIFQLHHAWLDYPIIESIAACGESEEEALGLACENFYHNILTIFIMAVNQTSSSEMVEGFTQERHYFHVYRSKVNGLGKREGIMEGDFWDLLKDEIVKRLGNKKAYWVKVFTSKNKNRVLCEVRINGEEAADLSECLLSYAQNWDCLGTYHTEKQGILLIQDEDSYEESEFTKEDIKEYTYKAIKLFEKCKDHESYKKIRSQLIKICKDDSLAYEIFSFVPEIYCKHAYKSVEFGDKLFMVQKDKGTRELYQSQVQSFRYIEEAVNEHIEESEINRLIIEQVIHYSANARAIEKAVDGGDVLDELCIQGIGYYVKNDYILR